MKLTPKRDILDFQIDQPQILDYPGDRSLIKDYETPSIKRMMPNQSIQESSPINTQAQSIA